MIRFVATKKTMLSNSLALFPTLTPPHLQNFTSKNFNHVVWLFCLPPPHTNINFIV